MEDKQITIPGHFVDALMQCENAKLLDAVQGVFNRASYCYGSPDVSVRFRLRALGRAFQELGDTMCFTAGYLHGLEEVDEKHMAKAVERLREYYASERSEEKTDQDKVNDP